MILVGLKMFEHQVTFYGSYAKAMTKIRECRRRDSREKHFAFDLRELTREEHQELIKHHTSETIKCFTPDIKSWNNPVRLTIFYTTHVHPRK